MKAQRKIFSWIVTASAVVATAGCGDSAQKEAPQPQIDAQSVTFPAGSAQLGSITSEKIEPRREATLRFNGRLIWDEDRTVRVFSPFGGRVLSIGVKLGETVRPGQTLAVFASPELGMAQSEARKAEQDDALARKSLARIEELFGAGVAPAKDLQAAQRPSASARRRASSCTARWLTRSTSGSHCARR